MKQTLLIHILLLGSISFSQTGKTCSACQAIETLFFGAKRASWIGDSLNRDTHPFAKLFLENKECFYGISYNCLIQLLGQPSFVERRGLRRRPVEADYCAYYEGMSVWYLHIFFSDFGQVSGISIRI